MSGEASKVREVLPRIAALRRLVEGARVLEIGGLSRTRGRSAEWLAQMGARAVVSVDEDAARVSAARESIVSAKIRFVHGSSDDFPPASFELIWVHDLEVPLDFSGLASRLERGHLVLGLAAEELGGAPGYRALLERLGQAFPSVEVATQRPLFASVLSFGGAGALPLYADPTFEPPPAASAYLFICGAEPSGLGGQWIVPLPPEEGGEDLRRALAQSEARAERLARALQAAEEKIEALEARAREDWPDPDAEVRRLDELERRLRDLREREEMARRRAQDAEERVRELERRSERWQSSRAEVLAALRLERVRAVAERGRLVEEGKRGALEAERRLKDRDEEEG